MITYNWKAEFGQKELEFINRFRERKSNDDPFPIISQDLVAEMANALDRYEAILNEMQETKENK